MTNTIEEKLAGAPPRHAKKRGYLSEDEICNILNDIFGTFGWDSYILSCNPSENKTWIVTLQIDVKNEQDEIKTVSHIGESTNPIEATNQAFRGAAKSFGRRLGLGLNEFE